MNRRQARSSLGSRSQRRFGTKTKVIPKGNNNVHGPSHKYTYWRHQKTKVRVLVNQRLREDK